MKPYAMMDEYELEQEQAKLNDQMMRSDDELEIERIDEQLTEVEDRLEEIRRNELDEY